jgi:BirA family biotin operon repressor/biotin-[acetyl-CoA-carboxylase] ligase
METLPIRNPFGAPVYYKETVTSTMDEARMLAGAVSGTVIAADGQTAGRGRSGRPWQADSGENLSFTVVLRYGTVAAIPPCLTLRTGLAVSYAIEDFAALVQGVQLSPLAGRVLVKWPNDVMLPDRAGRGKKAVGILTEAEGGTVYIGIGVNLVRQTFPPELAGKACSIAQALAEWAGQGDLAPKEALAAKEALAGKEAQAAALAEQRFTLLELILSRLHKELETAGSDTGCGYRSLRERLEDRLYMKGQKVCFVPGLPEELSCGSAVIQPAAVEGTLQGIGEGGEILITADSGETLSFITGELKVYL